MDEENTKFKVLIDLMDKTLEVLTNIRDELIESLKETENDIQQHM